jgi:hypothetical protein
VPDGATGERALRSAITHSYFPHGQLFGGGCGPAIDSVQPDKCGSGRWKELGGSPCAADSPERICGNDVEPYAKEFVFLSATELFVVRKFLSRFSAG